ncbi:hypothetical protein TRFO_19355 [Tritrichomonas foetus]|uniref:Uncharacterized protein n=1 Tax=Tritrichomonas foetus TaxID=1144522 RepID=A0A1J4KN90_9EUKA|nr:hypothetical protein TRFO_19355 [Tritrichomonas foetus]|eukprot:OHT11260.1 hypothetical protein TRFO_19355 [Tritrichomonas foetus]
MSTPADLSVAAINLAIETTSNALAVEQENNKLREQLHKNQQLLGDFDVAAPRAQLLQKQLKEKEALLEEKRKELVDVQASIISTLKNQSQTQEPKQQSLESIPIVMNHVQKYITDLTETAVDEKTIAVPVLSLFKVTNALNKLFDTLVSSNIIDETDEEKEVRIRGFIESQQGILNKLREITQNSQDEEEEEVEPAPKVEEVTEQPQEAEAPPEVQTENAEAQQEQQEQPQQTAQ